MTRHGVECAPKVHHYSVADESSCSREVGMTKVKSLPASLQRELAARAVRACMAAEAAMASLRAECKPLQITSTQSVLSLNAMTMGNAHKSLRLQIEACESSALSATAAFMQLLDVTLCVGTVKSESRDHTAYDDYPKTSNTQLRTSTTTCNGEFPESRPRPPQVKAADESSARSIVECMSVDATDRRSHWSGVQVNNTHDPIPWGRESDAACMRFPSPETQDEQSSQDEIVVQCSVGEAEWESQLGPRHSEEQEDVRQSVDHILSSEIHEESDASELTLDLTSEISSPRNILTSSTDSTESEMDNEFTVHKVTRSKSTLVSSHMGELKSGFNKIQRASSFEILESNNISQESVNYSIQAGASCHEETARTPRLYGELEKISLPQVAEAKSPLCVSDAHSGVSSQMSAESPPPASSSSTDRTERCISHGFSELQPNAPSYSTCLASGTKAEMNQTSSESQFSWSCESPRYVDAPSISTQSLVPSEHNQNLSCAASMDGCEPRLSSSHLPLYPAHPTSNNVSPTSASSIVRRLNQEFNLGAQSLESQEFTGRKLQPSITKENGHSAPLLLSGGEDLCEENILPLTPSPYVLKMRSMFCRPSIARKPSSGHSVSGPFQNSFGRSEGSLFSVATVVGADDRRPLTSSGLPTGSPAHIFTMEKKATELVDGRPLCSQSAVSSTSTSVSAPSSSIETRTSSNTSDFNYSGRKGSLENYKDKLETLQVQFPNAHASFFEEPQYSWGASRMVAPVCTLVAQSSLHNVRHNPWQASSRVNTAEMDRCVGTAYIGGSHPALVHVGTQEQATGLSCGYIQRNFSAGHPDNESLDSHCRYNGTEQVLKICERKPVGVNIYREFCDLTTTKFYNKDFPQKPISWRWNDDQQFEETGLPLSRDRETIKEVMVAGANDCVWGVSTLRPTKVSDTDNDNDDEDNSSCLQREWNEILFSMQQRGKSKASNYS